MADEILCSWCAQEPWRFICASCDVRTTKRLCGGCARRWHLRGASREHALQDRHGVQRPYSEWVRLATALAAATQQAEAECKTEQVEPLAHAAQTDPDAIARATEAAKPSGFETFHPESDASRDAAPITLEGAVTRYFEGDMFIADVLADFLNEAFVTEDAVLCTILIRCQHKQCREAYLHNTHVKNRQPCEQEGCRFVSEYRTHMDRCKRVVCPFCLRIKQRRNLGYIHFLESKMAATKEQLRSNKTMDASQVEEMRKSLRDMEEHKSKVIEQLESMNRSAREAEIPIFNFARFDWHIQGVIEIKAEPGNETTAMTSATNLSFPTHAQESIPVATATASTPTTTVSNEASLLTPAVGSSDTVPTLEPAQTSSTCASSMAPDQSASTSTIATFSPPPELLAEFSQEKFEEAMDAGWMPLSTAPDSEPPNLSALQSTGSPSPAIIPHQSGVQTTTTSLPSAESDLEDGEIAEAQDIHNSEQLESDIAPPTSQPNAKTPAQESAQMISEGSHFQSSEADTTELSASEFSLGTTPAVTTATTGVSSQASVEQSDAAASGSSEAIVETEPFKDAATEVPDAGAEISIVESTEYSASGSPGPDASNLTTSSDKVLMLLQHKRKGGKEASSRFENAMEKAFSIVDASFCSPDKIDRCLLNCQQVLTHLQHQVDLQVCEDELCQVIEEHFQHTSLCRNAKQDVTCEYCLRVSERELARTVEVAEASQPEVEAKVQRLIAALTDALSASAMDDDHVTQLEDDLQQAEASKQDLIQQLATARQNLRHIRKEMQEHLRDRAIVTPPALPLHFIKIRPSASAPS